MTMIHVKRDCLALGYLSILEKEICTYEGNYKAESVEVVIVNEVAGET